MTEHMIKAEGLVKRFGATLALDGLDLLVPAGTVLGLLGPNGAGKTTTVRILTTLLRPDGGRAMVGGHDVVTEPDAVRRIMGVSGQYAAVDEYLTGRENLEMFGRLYHLSAQGARRRAVELLERFDLGEAASRPVKTYSGGMRRRLDLAASLVFEPEIIFLDEPTTGLDPRNRMAMWAVIRELVADGATLLLTTQYLEEADELADEIAIIDRGRVVGMGTADQLKAKVGGERVEFGVPAAELATAATTVERVTGNVAMVHRDARMIEAAAPDGIRTLVAVLGALQDQGVEVRAPALRRPTLDEVFLALTGEDAPVGAR